MNHILFDNEKITPSKVVCIGRNYVDHIKELGNETPTSMVVFNKPNSAITETLNFFSEDTRYEGEICFLIKDRQISGVGFGLDLTKANIQNELKSKSLPWERAKSFNGSAVLSSFVEIDSNTSTLSQLKLELYINNELRQEGDYSLMMYKPQDIIKEVDDFMNLNDGDVIMSGTPKGVGTYKKGDKFEGKIYLEDKLILSQTWIVI